MKKNKGLIYLYTFTNNFVLYLSLLPYIYQGLGLSLIQISSITAIAHIMISIFEIPTGIIADRMGKRVSILLGIIASIIGLIFVIVMPKTYIYLVIWVSIQSLSVALISGADKAMIYEYLDSANEKESFHKIMSMIMFISRMASFIATVLCGKILSSTSFTVVLIITLCFKIIALASMYCFNPNIDNNNKEKSINQNTYKDILINSIKIVITDKKLLFYFLFNSFLVNLSGLIWEFRSLFVGYKLDGKTIAISSIIAILTLIFSFSFYLSSYMKNILKKDRENMFYILLPGTIILASALPSFWGMLFFILFIISGGIFIPYMGVLLNESIPDKGVRATLLSISSLVDSLIYSLFSLIFGYLSSSIGFLKALQIFSLMLIIIYALLITFKKIKVDQSEKTILDTSN